MGALIGAKKNTPSCATYGKIRLTSNQRVAYKAVSWTFRTHHNIRIRKLYACHPSDLILQLSGLSAILQINCDGENLK